MAAPHHSGSNHAVSPDTLITIKISVNDVAKRFKLPLRDLGISVLPDKLRQTLDIKPHQDVVFERYSDSASGYIILDEKNPQVFKTLIRAAKAKLKLRLKATITPVTEPVSVEEKEDVVGKSTETPVTPSAVRGPNPSPALASEICGLQSKQNTSRDSTALDQRSIGSGIFQFREARASQQTLVNDEALVPRTFTAEISSSAPRASPQPALAFRSRATTDSGSNFGHAWSVYCNECDKSMADAHYHCGICDGGDYDLCEECVEKGKLCPGEGHWLIKRFIKDGKVIHSTTERISPRPRAESTEKPVENVMPGAFAAETKTLAVPPLTRTCNNCVIVLPERDFVTCTACEDFDLCLRCHAADKHGHHPAHGFERATMQTVLTLTAESKLAPGRNVRHNAICDGCDQKIYGIRHKCLNCPDWDYCNECVKKADETHRHHRFAALFTPIADISPAVVRHYGIYCDGPLCNNKADQQYIQGVRYKCAICNDVDFCAACEALPNNPHNATHPLIKFKTPVRNVNVSTENEDIRGNVRMMGDRPAAFKNASTETPSIRQANAAMEVHTVAEIKPTEVKKEEASISTVKSLTERYMAAPANDQLNAHFVRDSIPDGHVVEPEARFAQVWTMKNPGPYTWPAGCSVRYVGGDNMLNVDNRHPASVMAIAEATESNIVGRPVNVGEEVAFKVVLKAPIREGKSISYWRLKAPDGTPFGHRLWCDIDVQKSEPVAPQPAVQKDSAQAAPPPPYNVHTAQQQQILTLRAQHVQAMMDMQRKQTEAMQKVQQLRQAASQQLQQPPNAGKIGESLNEEERRAAALARMAQLRADVMKNRNHDDLHARLAAFQRARAEKQSEEGEKIRKMTDGEEKVKKIIEEVAKDAEADRDQETENLEGSQMVFPKLDKESPASSTYQSMHSSSIKGKAAYVENEDGEIERSATPNPAPVSEFSSPVGAEADDVDDDLEVLSANDESENDGFMTDEEYDILDASDQETVASLK